MAGFLGSSNVDTTSLTGGLNQGSGRASSPLGQSGGSSSSGGGAASQTASKQSAKSTQTGSQITKGATTEVGSKTGTSSELQSFNLDTMDPKSRQALEQLLGVLQGGGSSQFKDQQAIFMQSLQGLANSVQQFDPAAAQEMASGNVAQLTRNLMEQQLPQIFGAQEAAGLSGDALSALLAQDATVRTAEAQQRAQLEALLGVGGLQNQAQLGLAQAAQAPDQNVQNILAALGIGKGSVQQGTVSTAGSTAENSLLKSITDTNQQSSSFSDQITDLLSKQSSSDPQGDLLARLALAQSLLPKNQSLARFSGNQFGQTQSAQADAMGLVGIR